MKILIKKCPDPMMWYAGKIGEEVELVREDSEYYWSRESAGHLNIVKKEDAEIVGVGMTHDCLVAKSAKWLKRHEQNVLVPNCSTVVAELSALPETGEIPDVIGWNNWTSVLIEVKMSRSDFLADAKKQFRKQPELGIGELRLYCCPIGLISIDDLPERWGLLHCDKKGKIEIIQKALPQRANLRSERSMLLSINRRK